MSSAYTVPLFLRGEVITDDLVSFGTRSGDAQFQAPDMARHVHRLPLPSPMAMTDLNELSFDEIVDVLRLWATRSTSTATRTFRRHTRPPCWRTPCRRTCSRNSYQILQPLFARANVLEIADSQVGLGYLNGWVGQTLSDGRELRVRAFGSRVLHIPAGNGGLVSAVTILRSVITRCDTIIKAPSNDPLTAVAIARTLADVARDHPITRHLAVAYWKGGDVAVEEPLYRPEHIEKIVAWGGFASVKHVTRYIQPGLEMIALDPKRSATIIGQQAFRRRRNHARGGALRRRRHRRRQSRGVRQRARHLRDERNRHRGYRRRQQARRDDLRGTHPPARIHQYAAAVPEPRTRTTTSRRRA